MQSVLEKAFGGSSITPGGKQEIDRGTGRVDGPIQIGPLALHPNVSLIDPPGAISRLQFATTTRVQFRRIALDPSPDGRVVGWKASLGYHPTAQVISAGSKWRHLNQAGRDFHTLAAYQ